MKQTTKTSNTQIGAITISVMPPKSKLKLPPLPLHIQKEPLGQRLTRIRKERGLTQVDLADKMGIIQELVSSYERNRLRMHADMVIRFSLALGISTDELLGIRHTQSSKKQNGKLDLKLTRRIKRISTLPSVDQKILLKTIDNFIRGAAGSTSS